MSETSYFCSFRATFQRDRFRLQIRHRRAGAEPNFFSSTSTKPRPSPAQCGTDSSCCWPNAGAGRRPRDGRAGPARPPRSRPRGSLARCRIRCGRPRRSRGSAPVPGPGTGPAPRPPRRGRVADLLPDTGAIIHLSTSIIHRARTLEAYGLKAADAVHVAAAEAAEADVFLTCDDRLLKACQKNSYATQRRCEEPPRLGEGNRP